MSEQREPKSKREVKRDAARGRQPLDPRDTGAIRAYMAKQDEFTGMVVKRLVTWQEGNVVARLQQNKIKAKELKCKYPHEADRDWPEARG